MELDLIKEYEELRKRYSNLPEFNEINVNFELSIFEPRVANSSLFAKYLRKVCGSYIENLCGFLTNLLHPNPQFLIGQHENKFLSEEDKKILGETIKENMVLVRWASSTTVIYDEQNEINAILRFHEQMKKNKQILKEVFTKLNKGWEDLSEHKEEKGHYVG